MKDHSGEKLGWSSGLWEKLLFMAEKEQIGRGGGHKSHWKLVLSMNMGFYFASHGKGKIALFYTYFQWPPGLNKI